MLFPMWELRSKSHPRPPMFRSSLWHLDCWSDTTYGPSPILFPFFQVSGSLQGHIMAAKTSIAHAKDDKAQAWTPNFGAVPDAGGTRFRVWAPKAASIVVELAGADTPARTFDLEKGAKGVFEGFAPGIGAGDLYRYRIDDSGPFPDPASRFQPEGVHGPSEVVDPGLFAWTDDGWEGIPPAELVIYELHVGTFSPEGTFGGVTSRLPYLKDLGSRPSS